MFTSDEAGSNRLACDVIDWEYDSTDSAADATIKVRVLRTSVSSSTDTDIWVWYNSDVTESQPAASNTFGSDNAYPASWSIYLPFRDTPGNTGTETNRTSSTANGTSNNMDGTDLLSGANAKMAAAYDFDGANDYVSVANGADVNVGTGDFTLLTWLYSISDDARFFSGGGYSNTVQGYSLAIKTAPTELEFECSNGTSRPISVASGGADITLNAWNFVAVSVDRDVGYEGRINGVSVFSNGATDTSTDNFDIETGHDLTFSRRSDLLTDILQCRMEDARLIKAALSNNYLDTIYNNENAPGTFITSATPQDATVTDVTSPTVSSASIDTAGTSLTINLDESVNFGAGGNGGFALSTGQTLTYSGGAPGTALVYSISPAVQSGATPTLAYTQPGDGVEDAAGNDLATFSGQAITNNSTVTAGTITTDPIKNYSGTAQTTGTWDASVYNKTTDALVVKKTGLTPNGSGVITFNDVLITAATTYRVDLDNGTIFGNKDYTAT